MDNREATTGPANQSTHDSVTHALNMTVFRDMVLCRLVQVDQHFRRANCLHHQSPDVLWTSSNLLVTSYSDRLLQYIFAEWVGTVCIEFKQEQA
jgi:hypothetical protein